MVAVPRVLHKVGWNVLDQGLSAMSNVALAVVIARSVDASSFGAFAVSFTVFGIVVALTKAVVGQPFQMAFSAAPADLQRAQSARAFGFAVQIGLVAAAGTAVAAALVDGALASALAALAVALPALLVQDSCRMAMFAAGRADRAALIDAVWVLTQFSLLAVLLTSGRGSIFELMLAWGVGATLSAVVGLLVLRVRPRLREGIGWIRDQRHVARYLFPEYFLGIGSAQLAILSVGLLVSASAVGSLRAVQVLLGPFTVLGTAAFQFAVPEVARRHLTAPQLSRFGFGVSAVLGLTTLSYVTVLLLMPDGFGAALFGDSWRGASGVVLPIGIGAVASAFAIGPASVLYGLGQASVPFKIGLVKGPILIGSVLVAAWLSGVHGAAWTLGFMEIAALPVWVLAFRRALRRHQPAVDPSRSVAPVATPQAS